MNQRSRRTLDAFAGCLLGGAVGDALGAPVEFLGLREIRTRFGESGLAAYAPAYGRTGAITDDTQMTLFTAEGLLRARNRWLERGLANVPAVIYRAYRRWLRTQGEEPRERDAYSGDDTRGWLFQVEELHRRRAPGTTCLSALRTPFQIDATRAPNDSKGCGGVMRVAPIGLVADEPFDLACQAAALTHGHPSGYLAAGAFAEIVGHLVRGADLSQAIAWAQTRLQREPDSAECVAAIDQAVHLAHVAPATPETVERMGGGWVAEEALAISLFCSLKATSFAQGVLLAVNHSGDSDSTGAITGNLLGLLFGRQAIPPAWLDGLELREVIQTVADDLYADFVEHRAPDYDRYPPY